MQEHGLQKFAIADNEGALKELSSAINLIPNNASFLKHCGSIKVVMHDYKGARKDLELSNKFFQMM
jgi:hypothetical protein